MTRFLMLNVGWTNKGNYALWCSTMYFVAQKGKWRHHAVKTLAKQPLKYRHERFTFILVPDVEPTNNAAERTLRPCVQQRKIGGCFKTKEGAKNRDIMMSVIGTMKILNKDFFTYEKEYILSKLS